LLVGTSNGVDSTPATCTITSSCSLPDVELPVIENTPRDSEAFASATACEAMVTWTEPTATDNCTPAPTLSYAVTEGGNLSMLVRGGDWPVGVYLVTYSAQDANLNDAIDTTFMVTVTDDGLPTVTAPNPVSAECTGTTGQVIAIGHGERLDLLARRYNSDLHRHRSCREHVDGHLHGDGQ